MVADSKKVQSMINRCAEAILKARAAVGEMEAVRTAFTTHNPDVTGTPLEGQVATVNAAINSLRAEVDSAVWNAIVAAAVPSHRGRALD